MSERISLQEQDVPFEDILNSIQSAENAISGTRTQIVNAETELQRVQAVLERCRELILKVRKLQEKYPGNAVLNEKFLALAEKHKSHQEYAAALKVEIEKSTTALDGLVEESDFFKGILDQNRN